MSSDKAELGAPLLHAGSSDYESTTQSSLDVSAEPKFGEYVSRAKARANNSMKFCGLPFNICMLVCIMFLTFGSYWCYDIPGSIETELTAWYGSSYTHASNLLFYSIYSWPNTILAFFGGFILDKLTGVRKGAMLFCGLVALGQLIFSMGCQWKMYYLALFGRFVFGLGGENLTVAQNTYTVRWFDGKRLALAFGLVVAFSRIGTSVNFVVSPILAGSPITYTQNVYADGGCGMVLPDYIPMSAEVNKCHYSRIVECDTLKSDDVLPSLITFDPKYGSCGGNVTGSTYFSSLTCFKTPGSLNATHPSSLITLNADTSEYQMELFTTKDCSGAVASTTYGQGTGCFNGTVAGVGFRVVQGISSPCTVKEYSDDNCLVEYNRYGMTRDQCVTPLNPAKHSYKYTIDPGHGVPLTVWFGMMMCGLSFVACCLASYFDYWGESKVESDRQVFMATLSPEESAHVKRLDDMNEPTSDDISFKMVTRISASAWLLFIITAVFYVAILNFYQVASDMMQNTGNFISDDTAGLYMAIPNFVAIVGSPLGGFTVDKVGRALNFIVLACAMLICAHVFFLALAYGWVNTSPVPVMIWLGITYSIGASSLWPILAFIVDKDALGTAYGCMTSVQNLFLAVFSVIIGQLQDWASSKHPGVLQYTLPIMIFIGCATIALIFTLVLIVVDRNQNGGKLNASAEERHARLSEEEAENAAASVNASDPMDIASKSGKVHGDDGASNSPSIQG